MSASIHHQSLNVMPHGRDLGSSSPRIDARDDEPDRFAMQYMPPTGCMRALRLVGIRYSRSPLPTWTYEKKQYDNWHGERYITGEPKPALRGVLHLVCACTLMPIEAYFVVSAVDGLSAQAHVAALLPLAVVWLLLLVSGIYHRVRWTTQAQHDAALRCDHADIFLSGAASLTAQALLMRDALDVSTQRAGSWLMLVAWALAAAGIAYSFIAALDSNASGRLQYVRVALYLSLGGCVLVFFYWLTPLLSTAELVHQVANLVIGLISIVFFAFRLLDLWPDVLGTHEVFHLLVVVATSSSVWLAARLAQHL